MTCNSNDATPRDDQAPPETSTEQSPGKSKITIALVGVIATLATTVLVVGLLTLEQQFRFIGLFDDRRPAVVHDIGGNTTAPAEETLPVDIAIQRQLGLPATPASFHVSANVHLRAQPNTQAESLGIVGIATHVLVLEYYSEDWFRVEYGDEVGYMVAAFLSTTRHINIASPEVLNGDRAMLDRVFGRGAASQPRANGDGTYTHNILYEDVTVRAVTWREGGEDMFRVHDISVNLGRDRNTHHLHMHGVGRNSSRNDILDALGDTVDAWHGRFEFRDGDITMTVSFGSNQVHHMFIRVDFAEHHFWPPEPHHDHYHW